MHSATLSNNLPATSLEIFIPSRADFHERVPRCFMMVPRLSFF